MLERSGALAERRAKPSWAIPSRDRVAHFGASGSIVATNHIGDPIRVTVEPACSRGVRWVGCSGVVGYRVNAGNDRRRHAGAAKDQPSTYTKCVIHVYASAGVADSRDVSDRSTKTVGVCPDLDKVLPSGLRLDGTATAARSIPGGLAPGAAHVVERGATGRHYGWRGGWILGATRKATVARGEDVDFASMLEVEIEAGIAAGLGATPAIRHEGGMVGRIVLGCKQVG